MIQRISLILIILIITVVAQSVGAVTSNFSITVNPLIQCNDGVDNDGDSFIDFPDDPECASATDNIEEFQQCSDNYDNDSDGLIDFPADTGCIDIDDNDEITYYECNDGVDNDDDGDIDYPADNGCSSLTDDDEQSGHAGNNTGGSSGFTIEPVTSISLSGWAYPNRKVYLLKDAQVFMETIAGPDAKFEFNLANISAGNYNFSLYADDLAGRRSTLFTFSTSLSHGASMQVSGVFIPPTIMSDLLQVKRGDPFALFGQTVPNSAVKIFVHSEAEIEIDTFSNAEGVYEIDFDSALLADGEHVARSKTTLSDIDSTYSHLLTFQVGDVNISRNVQVCTQQKADLNCDGKVNLVDFSIAAFWYKKILSPEFGELERLQLNNDNKLDLYDFSIMAYYWTG